MKKYLLFLIFSTFLFFQIALSQVTSPILSEPPDVDRVVSTAPTFRWQDLTGVLSYTIDIANDPLFFSQSGTGITVTSSSYTMPGGVLSSNTLYYWRVRGNYSTGPGPYSTVFSFTTAGTPGEEVDYLRGIINNLEQSNSLNITQGNILINRLNQAQVQLNSGNNILALYYLALFDVRVFILKYSGMISADNAQILINYDGKIINLIIDGNNKLSANEYLNYLTPKEFSLNQNYPNPFNPSTNIEYSIPAASNVKLKVYDMLGKEVATLVDKQQDAGTYVVNWNASSLSSGVYFYRISAGSFVQTKRMILSK